jgi:hypothetical protein
MGSRDMHIHKEIIIFVAVVVVVHRVLEFHQNLLSVKKS